MNNSFEQATQRTASNRSSKARPIVIVGAGPVGIRTAQELVKRGETCVIINAETSAPYNRVKLTPLLSGEAHLGQVLLNRSFDGPGEIKSYDNCAVLDIDRELREVTLSTGRVQPYETLVLATGSRAFVPKIEGSDLSNVFTFRHVKDAEGLLARSFAAQKVLVIGGGLLGLEAARGMKKRGSQVTVVEHESRLMPRQLDDAAGNMLGAIISGLGINVMTGARVTQINGQDRVTSVSFSEGDDIEFDTVIICVGVRANTQIAQAADLQVKTAIVVDETLRTQDPNIFAVGECAEYDGIVCGLVGPGYEQAMTAVDQIMGITSTYTPTLPVTKLKVVGAEVFSMGEVEKLDAQVGTSIHIFEDNEANIYRKLFLRRGKILGALGVGDWPEATKLQQAIKRNANIRFWNTLRFNRTGHLWAQSDDDVASMPADTIICNCTGVTKGAIQNAMTLGANTLPELQSATSCSTICGTCKPLVFDLLGQGDTTAEPAKWWRAILAFSGLAIFAALLTAVIPRINLADTYVIDDIFRNMWFDSLWKQYSGYSLLGLTVISAGIGLRKRIRFMARLGSFDFWRISHLILGALSALVLIWHTGFRVGSNLNLILMVSFLIVLGFGAIAGLATGGEHDLQSRGISSAKKPARTLPMWVHVVALWPLPALLIFHILLVYKY